MVGHIGQHAGSYLFEHRHPRGGRLVGRRVQPVGLVLDDRGEERPLVREVVIHQCPRHPSALGDLIDANLVVRPLPKDLRPQSEQFSAAVLRG
ncbi:Uncharacterised protein [Mycobacterium tuberculosis]|nr:Uncharacterised protein [Mycobacterium tuberculosis]